jgi:hypothetical protein
MFAIAPSVVGDPCVDDFWGMIMASGLFLQLANSEGLLKVVVFTGLSHPVVVHPIVHGEPILTAQAFYYLEELESVAQLRFETGTVELTEEEIEYLLDNYLFEYSKAYPDATMSFKVSRGKFWSDDPSSFYRDRDQGHTQSLALDRANDSHVLSIEALDPGDKVDLSDWNIGENYARECFEPYLESLTTVLDKKVRTAVSPSDRRDGYVGKLRVLKSGYGLINHSQAVALADISVRSIGPSATEVLLRGSESPHTLAALTIERIVATRQHTPILLSYYFSGLKEYNPLKGFIGFYNVLEYYFEEAPRLLQRSASTELSQLHCVVDLLTTEQLVTQFLSSLQPAVQRIVFADLPTSSGIVIRGFDVRTDARGEMARWLYEIRCAVIHSKKTRRGRVTATFEPYSSTSQIVRHVLPVVRWLAVLCIEKDHTVRTA